MLIYIGITITVLLLACIVSGKRDASEFAGAFGVRPIIWHKGISVSDGSRSIVSSRQRGACAGRFSMFLIVLALWIPAALRQETGNDYMRYVEFFHLASVDAYVPTEPGFNAFVTAVYKLCGYENYLLVFALFSLVTIVLFAAAIRQQAEYKGTGHFLFTFFLFMMFGYYFQSYNTVRYYLALAAALYSLKFFIRKQYLSFLAVILTASLFHRSVLIVLLLYPLCTYSWKKWQAAAAGVFCASAVVFQDLWMKVIIRLYPSYEDTDILAAGGQFSPANTARCLAVLILVFIVYRACERKELFAERKLRFYINAAWLSLFIYVFGYFIPEISRICYYLTITQIFLLPELIIILNKYSNKKNKERIVRVITAAVVLSAVMFFAAFLKSASKDNIRILPYKTFLFHEMSETPSRSIR